MSQQIENFVKCQRMAVVGVSHDSKKFGNTIYQELKARSYQVYGVNPSLQEIDNEPCYPNLTALKGKIDGVVICLQPAKTAQVLREAADIGLDNIWLQQGAESPEALKAAQDLGLNPVVKKCILMYMPPVQSLHKFHRFFAKLFGQF
jgi:uncharacterized protein